MLEMQKIKKMNTPSVVVTTRWNRVQAKECGGVRTSGRAQGPETEVVDTLMVQQKACMVNALCESVACDAGYTDKCIMMTGNYMVPGECV